MALSLSHDSIAGNLTTRIVGRQVVVYRSTASTNDLAWQYAGDEKNHGTAIFAENQTAGRGRQGNKWCGGESMSVLCSILLLDAPLPPDLLTLAAGVALAEAIGPCGRHVARLKWPNDVTLNSLKVAGILIESKTLRGGAAFVIGIGVNCCQRRHDFAPEIAGDATSIELASGVPCDRNPLARRLLIELDDWLAIAADDPRKVKDAWLDRSSQLNKRITLQHNNRSYTGTCIGVDPADGLILQLDGGGIRMFDASHTHTVRPA
jgi:BirA family transcriptional regulator, biotin operon repressor / biotin---[acetyl-CoA-carboxylase] ligase